MTKMVKMVVRDQRGLGAVYQVLNARQNFPFTVSIKDGAPRSHRQNALYHRWMQDLAAQGDMTAAEYTAHCKLYYGVPLLRASNEEYQEYYDATIKPLPIETKLKMMLEPFGFPVTRLMNTKEFKEYLDTIHREFLRHGFTLTDPDALKGGYN